MIKCIKNFHPSLSFVKLQQSVNPNLPNELIKHLLNKS